MRVSLFIMYLGLSVCVGQVGWAQTIVEKIPAKNPPIVKIIEWISCEHDCNGQTIDKGMVSEFNLDGDLLTYYDGAVPYAHNVHFKYDDQKRVVFMEEYGGETHHVYKYVYKADRVMKTITGTYVNELGFEFFNDKKQVVETKVFDVNLDTEALTLKYRHVYNYNENDSLFGVMNYTYLPDGSATKEKMLHWYEPVTNQKRLTQVYDNEGKLVAEKIYMYNDKGLLYKIMENDHIDELYYQTKLLYLDGKLWQSVKDYGRYKEINVYKEDLLVRTRYYNQDTLTYVSDFQYIYAKPK